MIVAREVGQSLHISHPEKGEMLIPILPLELPNRFGCGKPRGNPHVFAVGWHSTLN
jgi:hypothetical protein